MPVSGVKAGRHVIKRKKDDNNVVCSTCTVAQNFLFFFKWKNVDTEQIFQEIV